MATKNADLTVADLAEALGTDPRTARKFLRKVTPKEGQPGKGGRWVIPARNLTALKKGFAEYATTPEADDVSDAD